MWWYDPKCFCIWTRTTVAWNSLSFSLSLTLFPPPMINKDISIQFFYPHPLRTVDMHSTEIHHLSPSLWNGIYIQYPPMRDGQTHWSHWVETKIKMKMTNWRELYRSRSSTWQSKLSLKFMWNESIDGLITSTWLLCWCTKPRHKHSLWFLFIFSQLLQFKVSLQIHLYWIRCKEVWIFGKILWTRTENGRQNDFKNKFILQECNHTLISF